MSMTNQITIAPGGSDVTARLQAAIDVTADQGGGRVSLSRGIHTCHGIRLRSGVELHLESQAVLRPVSDYEAYANTKVDSVAEGSNRAMIVAKDAHDIAITGTGIIEAGGAAFITGYDADMGTWIPARLRPRVLVLDGCTDVTIENIAIQESPLWTIHAIACRNLAIRGILVENDRLMPNTDAIVVDACQNVEISNSELRIADDGVVLKTTARPEGESAGDCAHVRVSNCFVESRSCALKVGTETYGDTRDVIFEDCTVEASNRALGIFSRDGGVIEDVKFRRIKVVCRETPEGFWGSGEPVAISALSRRPNRPAGPIRNVVVEDISGVAEGAIMLISERPGDISGVTLRRIALTQSPGPLGTGQSYDLRPTVADVDPPATVSGRANAWVKDEEGRVIGIHPYPGGMPGLYAQHVTDLTTSEITFSRPDPLPSGWNPKAVVVDDMPSPAPASSTAAN